jgi:hypothetical protein
VILDGCWDGVLSGEPDGVTVDIGDAPDKRKAGKRKRPPCSNGGRKRF